MFGVNDNVYFCNMDKLESINSQIRNRNIPSEPLRPEFSLRPVATQRCVLPIVDNISPSCVPLQKYDQFSVEKVFNPGTAQGPWDGFAANINIDSLNTIINEQIQFYIPEISLIDTQVDFSEEEHILFVKIAYSIRSSNTTDAIQLNFN